MIIFAEKVATMRSEKILIKCDNTVFADEIQTALTDSGIASRQHEECYDTASRQIGITIFVYSDDYDKASAVIAPIIEARNKVTPMCPKCGSEDVGYIPANSKHVNTVSILCIFCFLLPGIYVGLPKQMMIHNDILDIIAAVVAIIGVVMLVVISRKSKNYECRKCGKKFYHIN